MYVYVRGHLELGAVSDVVVQCLNEGVTNRTFPGSSLARNRYSFPIIPIKR